MKNRLFQVCVLALVLIGVVGCSSQHVVYPDKQKGMSPEERKLKRGDN